jgi:hypothetical protein
MDRPPDVVDIERLARRVRWLDRYRRYISIGLGIGLSVVAMRRFAAIAGSDWPDAHVKALGIMCAVIFWWTTEVALAWITSVWETRCDHLLRERGLPRAELLPRRFLAKKRR